MSIDAGAQVAIFTHCYSHVDPVWSLLIVGTGFVPWVEFRVLYLVNGPPGFRASQEISA